MKRLAIALFLIAGLMVGAGVPPPSRAAGTGLVSWAVNHKKKTITVTVKIDIFLTDCPDGASYCGVTDSAIATYIAQNIREAWSGHHYKCYQLIIDVRVSVVPDRFRVSSGSVGILVDRSNTQGVRSDTRGTVGSSLGGSDRWQSNDPADRVEVTNTYYDPSTWSYPPTQNYSYAHEFGHVIGLDHYYNGDDIIDGAPDDVMNKSQKKFVSQETIDRAVERNADRMYDTDGKLVDLNKLQCDTMFRASFKADEAYYGASNLVDSLAKPPCGGGPYTHSTDQSLDVSSQSSDVQLLEDPAAAPLGYTLVPTFDVLTLQNGMHGGGRAANAIGLFDLPISVFVTRNNNTPARDKVPPPYDLKSGVCAEGGGGPVEPPDCGSRQYDSWMAMVRDADKLWPAGSSIPIVMKDLGYMSPRLEQLYKNCSGPTPWPGSFVDEEQGGQAMSVTKGQLPSLDAIKKVVKDWYSDDIPGRVTIIGKATFDTTSDGHLESHALEWTLTLCPLNQDGDPPPGCP